MGTYIPPLPQKDGSDIPQMIRDIKRQQKINHALYLCTCVAMVLIFILVLIR